MKNIAVLCTLCISVIAIQNVFGADAAKDTKEKNAAAERIERNGQRDANRGDAKGAKEAHEAAGAARNSKDAAGAQKVEKDYNAGKNNSNSNSKAQNRKPN